MSNVFTGESSDAAEELSLTQAAVSQLLKPRSVVHVYPMWLTFPWHTACCRVTAEPCADLYHRPVLNQQSRNRRSSSFISVSGALSLLQFWPYSWGRKSFQSLQKTKRNKLYYTCVVCITRESGANIMRRSMMFRGVCEWCLYSLLSLTFWSEHNRLG